MCAVVWRAGVCVCVYMGGWVADDCKAWLHCCHGDRIVVEVESAMVIRTTSTSIRRVWRFVVAAVFGVAEPIRVIRVILERGG